MDLPVGNHTLPVRFDGDDTYNASNTTVDIEVLPRPSEITAEVLNNTVDNVTIKAEVIDAETGLPVPNGPVEVRVNGVVVGTGEVIDGVAIIKTNLDKSGIYDFDVNYLGSINYTESDTTLVDVEVIVKEAEIVPEVLNNIICDTAIEVILKDSQTGDILANSDVVVTLPDGKSIKATTDENGILELPLDLPAGLNVLNITFPGNDQYGPTNMPLPVNVVKRNATLTPTVLDNTDGKAVIAIDAVDALNGSVIKNGTIELTLPDGTKVTAPINENGTAIFEDVDVPTGTTQYNATLLENPIYNEAYTNTSITNIPKSVIIGNWKLIRINEVPDNATNDTVVDEDTKPAKPVNKIRKPVKEVRQNSKYQTRYDKYNRYNRYNKKPKAHKPANVVPRLTKAQYRLLITLYADYFDGNMTYSDFVAILKLNGIEIGRVNDWNSEGVISIDYDDINDVPDSIELHDNSGHVKDYNSNIDKNNAPSSSGEIDSGDIEVESASTAAADGEE